MDFVVEGRLEVLELKLIVITNFVHKKLHLGVVKIRVLPTNKSFKFNKLSI